MASAQARSTSRVADEVWAVIGDFGGIASWMPGIESCRLEGETGFWAMTGMEVTEHWWQRRRRPIPRPTPSRPVCPWSPTRPPSR